MVNIISRRERICHDGITLRGSSARHRRWKKMQRLPWGSSPYAGSEPNIRCDLYFTHLLTVPSPLDILLSFFWMRNTSSSALIVGNLHQVPPNHKIGYKQARERDKQNFRRRYNCTNRNRDPPVAWDYEMVDSNMNVRKQRAYYGFWNEVKIKKWGNLLEYLQFHLPKSSKSVHFCNFHLASRTVIGTLICQWNGILCWELFVYTR